MFSGIGTEHHVGQVLLSCCDRSACGIGHISHSATFEILPRARKALKSIVDGPVLGDICYLLPTKLRTLATSQPRTFATLKRVILDQ